MWNLGRPECVSVAEFAVFLLFVVATHVAAFVLGRRDGYVRGRRDERLEWQPTTPRKDVH